MLSLCAPAPFWLPISCGHLHLEGTADCFPANQGPSRFHPLSVSILSLEGSRRVPLPLSITAHYHQLCPHLPTCRALVLVKCSQLVPISVGRPAFRACKLEGRESCQVPCLLVYCSLGQLPPSTAPPFFTMPQYFFYYIVYP